jgi:hypothetical protein
MSRPDHLLEVNVGYGGAEYNPPSRFVSSLKGHGLGTKKSGCDRYAFPWKSNANPVPLCRSRGLSRNNGLFGVSTSADITTMEVSGDDPGLAGLPRAR